MSTQATVSDPAAFQEALDRVRSDSHPDNNVLIVGHVDNKPDLVKLIDTSKELADLKDILCNKQVMYILARLGSKFDMSQTVKFVYIHWIGNDVPYALRARCGVVHESVRGRFEPFHLALEVDCLDDLDESAIINKLEDNSGKRSHILESQEASSRPERGFTAHQTKDQVKSSPTLAAPSSHGASISFDDSVHQTILEVRSDDNETDWMLASYRDMNLRKPLKPVYVVASGSGGLSELLGHVTDDTAMYGLLRTTDVVDDITTVKFIYIIWQGEYVKPMTKAKVATHKGSCDEVFLPAHVTIFATEMSEISEKVVMDKVRSASGTKSNVM